MRAGVPMLLLVATTLVAAQLLLPDRASASVGMSMGSNSFKYVTRFDSTDEYLIPLAEFDFRGSGFIDISLDVTLAVPLAQSDQGRTMLYLVVCDASALTEIENPPAKGPGSVVATGTDPAYCSMANRTLDELCVSFGLVDTDTAPNNYRSLFYYTSSLRDMDFAGANMLYLYIDACETVGGATGVLRSCLKSQPSPAPCFKCPLNNPYESNSTQDHCKISPPIPPSVHVEAAMNLCSSQGDCLGYSRRLEPMLYAGLTILWALATLIWITHINAIRDAAVELQQKLKLVPITQFIYTGMTCVQLSMSDTLVGTALNVVQNGKILAQLAAMAISAEALILIAKGWKITRESLQVREHQWIRFVTLLWATSYMVLKTSSVPSVAVFLVWGVTWAAIVFMIWYNSAFNMNMLKYQMAMVRELAIEPVNTPVYTKYMLFRRFRALLAIYMALSCVLGIMGMLNDTAYQRWQLSSSVADEALTLLLFVALGYTFRCRRFSRLMRASFAPMSLDGPHHHLSQSPRRLSSIIAPAPADEDEVSPPSAYPAKMVLVLNPDDAQLLGTAYQTPSPAKKLGNEPAETTEQQQQ